LADIELTRKISQASTAVGIKLLNHIIVAGDKYNSFMEKGILPDQGMDFTESHTKRNDIAQEEDEYMEI
jgi:hypothetical protein